MQATQPIAKKRRKKKQPIIYLSKERITSAFYASLKTKYVTFLRAPGFRYRECKHTNDSVMLY